MKRFIKIFFISLIFTIISFLPFDSGNLSLANEESVNMGTPNKPVIREGEMVPIKWDSTYNFWVTTTEDDPDWYNYNSVATVENSVIGGNGDGKWANVMTYDGLTYYESGNSGTTVTPTVGTEIPAGKVIATQGSGYVWIPRYSYDIVNGENGGIITEGNGGDIESIYSWNSEAYQEYLEYGYIEEGDFTEEYRGEIAIRFSEGTTDYTEGEYKAHPAFNFGTDVKLEGFWVAKYEASKGTNAVTNEIVNVPSSEKYVAQFIPSVPSWRNETVSNQFIYAYNTYRNADSHLMKNTEWGAVVYLNNAIGKIPYGNHDGFNYKTGIGGSVEGANIASSAPGLIYTWNKKIGIHASTTHNVYGIYDMHGGSWDSVAAYLDGTSNTHIAVLETYDEKYRDVYSANADGSIDLTSVTGDAVYETSKWDERMENNPTSSSPFFQRGNNFITESILSYSSNNGSNTGTFRVVLSIPKYTIEVTQGENGTISPETTTVIGGGNPEFTITPESGYSISSLVVDGVSQEITNESKMVYTFSNVIANHTITATFKKNINMGTPNKPVIREGEMVPVYWVDPIGMWVTTTVDDPNWYNYNSVAEATEQYSPEGNGDGKWANIMTYDGLTYYDRYQIGEEPGEPITPTVGTPIPAGKAIATNGSMYVWIPRYTYKIVSGEGEDGIKSWNSVEDPGTDAEGNKGQIEIKFSNGVEDDTDDEYKVHPAFRFGSYTGGDAGDDSSYWGEITDLEGIWVAKYQGSEGKGTSEVDVPSTSNNTVRFIPGVQIASQSSGGLYTLAYNTYRKADSHMMKNTEWGAVSYLTNAIGRVPYRNNNMANGWMQYAGYAGESEKSTTSDKTHIWNTQEGVKGSTTHNIYGIYDMNSYSGESTAAYYPIGYGVFAFEDVASNILTAKYVDKYEVGQTNKVGDATLETRRWDGSSSDVPDETGEYTTCFMRIGLFGYYLWDGLASNQGFRAVLAIPEQIYNLKVNNGIASSEGVVNSGEFIELVATPATGYEFINWTVEGITLDDEKASTITFNMPGNDVIITANFAPIYTITYNLSGGEEVVINPTSYTSATDTFTLNNPIKNGYTFAGWTGTGLDTPSTTVTIEKGSSGNRAYTATWNLAVYTIDYILDGGEVSSDNPLNYTMETDTFTLNNPTKEGYSFGGWTGTGLDAVTKTITIAKGSFGDRTYTANWNSSEYTITVVQGENGTISPDTINVNSGSTQGFFIKPDNGYRIVSVVVDGLNQVVTNSLGFTYTFSNINSNHEITATFDFDTGIPNKPVIRMGEMVPVKWDSTKGEYGSWVTTTVDDPNWYDYNSIALADDEHWYEQVEGNGNGKWANVMTYDGLTYYNEGDSGDTTIAMIGATIPKGKVIATQGSQYVWIPRFSYNIVNGENGGDTGEIYSWNSDEYREYLEEGYVTEEYRGQIVIKFSKGTTDYIEGEFKAHPAFNFGTDINGEEVKLEGFWVAKYEASKGEDAAINEVVDIPSSERYVAQFKPSVESWRNETTSDHFIYAYNTYRNADSHMMKNTEWGAVSYLTNAIGKIPYANQDAHTYLTGIGECGIMRAPSATYYWDYEGIYASTTHNVYGIYDMHGGLWDRVAAYADCLEIISKNTGTSTCLTVLETYDEKYIDVYEVNVDGSVDLTNTVGDAISETSGWDDRMENTPSTSKYSPYPFFVRGNNFMSGSMLSYAGDNGLKGSFYSFRAVLAIPSNSNVDVPNEPVLVSGMTPIKWEDGNESETNKDDMDWYNYSSHKWANAKDLEGNYWVWIPRYTYKIIGDEVLVRWSKGTIDDIDDGYKVHPAFVSEAYVGGSPNEASNYKEIRGANQLTGFWVAKYLVSDNNGDVLVSPNKYPDVNKTIEEAFDSCFNMDIRSYASPHLIKASEWGAVAYLSSSYGNLPNKNVTRKTGYEETYSTTNNSYGVFDMNGPVGEYLAAFVENGNISSNSKMINEEYERFVDVISLVGNDDTKEKGNGLNDFYGFAMSETKDFVLEDIEEVPTFDVPYFTKGGIDVGLYGYSKSNGTGLGFRPVIWCDNSYVDEDIAFFDTEASVVAGDYLVLSINFTVDEPFKFGLGQDETIIEDGEVVDGKESRIFDFIDLKYVQTDGFMTLTKSDLNEELIGIVEGDNILLDLDSDTTFKKDTQYTIRVKVGGMSNDQEPIFVPMTNMEAKIVVDSVNVKSVTSNNELKINSISNNKVRLSIFDISGREPVLERVVLKEAPTKFNYRVGEKLELAGGLLEIFYKGFDGGTTCPILPSNVPEFNTITNIADEDIFVELKYGEETVGQDSAEFRINVSNDWFLVSGSSNPLKKAAVLGTGYYEVGETVNLEAKVTSGYRFKNWISDNVTLFELTSIKTSFKMPNHNVNVVANVEGPTKLEVINPKTKFNVGDTFGLGTGYIKATYEDGSEVILSLTSQGVVSSPEYGEILNARGTHVVNIEYAGKEVSYDITVSENTYKLIVYITSPDMGSVKKDGINVEFDETSYFATYDVAYNTPITLEAFENSSYKFIEWIIDENSDVSPDVSHDGKTISFGMPQGNLIVKATFGEYVTIKYLAEEGGIINGGQTIQQVMIGGDTDLVIAETQSFLPDGIDYEFVEWDDGVKLAERKEINVKQDATYIAKFNKVYVIDVIQGNNGVISPGTTKVKPGRSQLFTITPDENYVITSLVVDNVSIPITDKFGMTYTFENVSKGHTLAATFEHNAGTPNAPVIREGEMVPVYWVDPIGMWVTTTVDDPNWYNYNSVAEDIQQYSPEGNGNGKWANVMTYDGLTYYDRYQIGEEPGEPITPTVGTPIPAGKAIATNGSMYVWIPRYTYKIVSGEGEDGIKSWNSVEDPGTDVLGNKGQIEIKFSNGVEDDTDGGYKVHPAFRFGSYTGGDAGDDSSYWGEITDLKGIWVSKYQGSNGTGTSEVDVPSTSNSTVRFVPGVQIASESSGGLYTLAYNTYRKADSHMMKNTEWGAVAYLTNAIGRIPYRNNNMVNGWLQYSGYAGESQKATTSGATHVWNTNEGVKGSTTHNIYGIYDMNSYAGESTAAYYPIGYGVFAFEDVASNILTAKYVDKYEVGQTNKVGDATLETRRWDGNSFGVPDETGEYTTCFMRNGLFGYYLWDGLASNQGFHVVLAIPTLQASKYTITTIETERVSINPEYTGHKCSVCGGYDHECDTLNIFITSENTDVNVITQ